MAIPKVKGIETEYSIVLRDKQRNTYSEARTSDFAAMINIIRQYFSLPLNSPDESLRAIENPERLTDIDWQKLKRLMVPLWLSFQRNLLPNGSRFYIDGPHLEYSTAECLSAKTLVAADRAGEAIVRLARKIINEKLAEAGEELIVRKDNSDRNGRSYGCHENYLVSRDAFDKIMSPHGLAVGYLASFLVCRLIFTGSGKMGVEERGHRLTVGDAVYQISQRADFIEALLSSSTVLDRGIVNDRDEPLADKQKFGRLHIICGDANLAEVANYMKVGITSIVLKMIEDGFLQGDIIIGDPVKEIKLVSRDLSCQKPVLETLGGRKLSATDLNEELFQRAQNYFLTVQEPTVEERDLLRKWEETISDFRTGNEARLRRRYDWKIKSAIFDYFLEAHNIHWEDIATAAITAGRRSLRVVDELSKKDILYHDLDEENGLYWRCRGNGDLEEVISKQDVLNLIKNPPPECRSYFRGRCLARFSDDICDIDWDSITFGTKFNKPVKSGYDNFSISSFVGTSVIGMINPIWGSKEDVDEIMGSAADYVDLLKKLQKREETG